MILIEGVILLIIIGVEYDFILLLRLYLSFAITSFKENLSRSRQRCNNIIGISLSNKKCFIAKKKNFQRIILDCFMLNLINF